MADPAIVKLILNSAPAAELVKYNIKKPTEEQVFSQCMCNLFHYANLANAFAYAVQYNEQPDCFPIQFATKDINDFKGGLSEAIATGAIYPTLNDAQDELRHLRYNIYTNAGSAFMPTPYEDLFESLCEYLIAKYPHIETEEEMATAEAYRRIYSD